MIRDKIVFSVSSKLQELLLHESNLDLKKATEICHTEKEDSVCRYTIDKIN